MNDLLDLKKNVLKEVKSFLCKRPHPSGVSTLVLPTKIKSLKGLIDFLGDSPVVYLKNQKNEEVLGLGIAKGFKKYTDLDLAYSLAKENPNADVIGALPFNLDQDLKSEWADFKDLLILPRVVFQSQQDYSSIKINILTEEYGSSELLFELERILDLTDNEYSQPALTKSSLVQEEAEWNQIVEKSISKIKASELKKVVLARTTQRTHDNRINSNKLFCKTTSAPNLYEFYFRPSKGSAFISFSPEKLFSINDNNIKIDSIAGTLENTGSNGEELLKSSKDLAEHRYVSNYIRQLLWEVSSQVKAEFTEKILTLPKLHHIHTRFIAKLSSHYSLVELVTKLHPTPAVGGLPKGPAMDFINANEGFNRGLYAAPFGKISSNNIEFGVGIRSFLVKENKIYFFGGAGIVEESNKEAEWNETAKKIESIQCMM